MLKEMARQAATLAHPYCKDLRHNNTVPPSCVTRNAEQEPSAG